VENLKNELFRPVAMAGKATVGGIISCSILVFLGIVGCAFVSKGRRRTSSIASENSNSFHAEEARGSSRSRTGSLNSVGTMSRMSSMSRSGISSNHPKSLSSIVSVVSRGTMTSENKGTMTDGHFDVEEEVRKLKKAAEEELSQTKDAKKRSTFPGLSGERISSNFNDASRPISIKGSYENEAFGSVAEDVFHSFDPKSKVSSFMTQT
jgi:hypothetical protein